MVVVLEEGSWHDHCLIFIIFALGIFKILSTNYFKIYNEIPKVLFNLFSKDFKNKIVYTHYDTQ